MKQVPCFARYLDTGCLAGLVWSTNCGRVTTNLKHQVAKDYPRCKTYRNQNRLNMTIFRQILHASLPERVRRGLRAMHQRYVLEQALKRFMQDPSPEALTVELMDDLAYGWANHGWCAQCEYLRKCLDYANNTQGSVLECGSGLSTLLLGIVAQQRGIRVWSLEHNGFWADRLSSVLSKMKINSVTICRVALRSFGEFDWYDVSLEQMPKDFSVVVCDGPPGDTLGGRCGLIPVMKEHLTPGCVIIADDVTRKAELNMLIDWANLLDTGYRIFDDAKRQFGVLTVPEAWSMFTDTVDADRSSVNG